MKKIKILALVLALLIGLVVLAAIGAVVFIDSIAKRGIEHGASYALDVPTTVDGVSIDLFGGDFGLNGLTIANPDGYSTPHFFSLNSGSASLDLASLQAETVEMPTLVLEGIDIYLDKEDGKANYEVIMESLKRFESGEAPAEQPADAPTKKFVIREIQIRDVTAHVEVLPVGGSLTTAEVKVPEIILRDVGEKDPVTVAKLTNVLLKAIFASVINVGGGVLPETVTDGLNAGLGGLTDLATAGIGVGVNLGEGVVDVVGDVGGAALDAAGDAVGAVGDTAQDAAGRIGGLLGIGDKDDEESDDAPPAEDPGGG